MRCALVGDEPLVAQCADVARTHGLEIVLVATTNELVRDDAIAHDVPVVGPGPGLVAGLDAHPADVLLSIANLRMISDEVLTRVQLAINYHDGPLPEYAGLNVTSWALLAGEHEHAITWHLMTRDVDAGEVVAVDRFSVDDDENAFSLNARCYEAALATFPRIAAALAAGEVQTAPQPEGTHRVFMRHDRPAIVLDPTAPAAATARAVRALDFGHRLRNGLGAVRWVLDGEAYVVEAAESAAATTDAAPGTLLRIDDSGVRIATNDGDLIVSRIMTPEGTAVDLSEVAARHGLEAGSPIAGPPAALTRRVRRPRAGVVPRRAVLDRPSVHRRADRPTRCLDQRHVVAGFRGAARAGRATRRCSPPSPCGSPARAARPRSPSTSPTSAARAALASDSAARHARAPRCSSWHQSAAFADVLAAAEAELANGRQPPAAAARRHRTRPAHAGPRIAPLPCSSRSAPTPAHRQSPPASRCASRSAPATSCSTLRSSTIQVVSTGSPRDSPRCSRPAPPIRRPQPPRSPSSATPSWHCSTRSTTPRSTTTAPRRSTSSSTPRSHGRRTRRRCRSARGCSPTPSSRREARPSARRLAAAGVGRGDRVGIAVPRGVAMLVGVLATFDLGAAYLPLDPTYPVERLAFMVDDAGIAVLLATGDTAVELGRPDITVIDPSEADSRPPLERARSTIRPISPTSSTRRARRASPRA